MTPNKTMNFRHVYNVTIQNKKGNITDLWQVYQNCQTSFQILVVCIFLMLSKKTLPIHSLTIFYSLNYFRGQAFCIVNLSIHGYLSMRMYVQCTTTVKVKLDIYLLWNAVPVAFVFSCRCVW